MGDRDRSRERQRRDRGRQSDAGGGRDRSADRDRKSTKSSNCRVYVSNIPYECRWQDLKDIFRNEVGDVHFVELFVDENDKIKGTGIVEFSDIGSVKKCIEVMNGFEVKNRKLVVKDDSGNMRDKSGRLIAGGGRRRDEGRHRDDRFGSQMSLNLGLNSGNVDGSKWGNTYGLSPSFLESLNINVPLCNRVFVANLEYNVDKKKLKEIFRLAGKVQRVDLHTDKDGRSRGFAVVEYDHPVEAVQAISMFNNQTLFDRVMTVRMDRVADAIKLPEGLKGIGMGLGVNGEPLRDVARNLPSGGSSTQDTSSILGSMPSQALQVATALSNMSNATVGNNSVLQAANLGGLLTNMGADLGLGGNSLVQNQNQLAALAGVGRQGNSSGLGGGNSGDLFGSGGGQSGSFGGGQGYGNRGGGISSSFLDQKPSGYGTGDSFGGQLSGGIGKSSSYSNKVFISNLPSSTSFKMLLEKFNEFGEVKHLEEKGNGNMLIVYQSDWQAERAIKNLDRARIDGRTIEARLYY